MSHFRAYFSWNSSHLVGASVVLGALAYLGAAPIACSANGERLFNNTGGGGSSNGGQGGIGTGGKAQGGDGGDPILTVGSTGSGSSCTIHCSADLHEVLDCNNAVVKTCPAGQGCEPGGTCVDACAAAEANGSTIGCEFYAVQPSAITQSRGTCYAAALANTWSTPIGLQVEYDGQMLDATQFARIPTGSGASLTYEPLPNGQLDPGKIAVLFLSQAPGAMPACPSPAAVAKDTSVPGSGLSKAFRIQATAPVVAYDIFPYGGAPSYVASATLLIPTPAWGTNYIAADAYEQEPAFSGINASPFMQIVGTQDNTQVTILPRVNIVGGPGVSIATKGQPATYLVNRGQVLQFLQNEELAGSPISSDKPIGVWGGS
ncbi:MAG TPA: IgGFc-binding protein, partial [Polyangium sp.]|nr:IgGFc-binding protein [Polyangium sp.]